MEVLPDQWFIVCEGKALRQRPLSRMLQNVPLVLFRDAEGQPHALVDRCPHRNVPLSAGRVRDGQLQCAYHGWKFDGEGQVREIPGLVGSPEAKTRCVARHAAREQQGFIWVYATPGVAPQTEPFTFPFVDAPGYASARQHFQVNAGLHATLENALDVPHTAFLHGGLFRTAAKRLEIDVVVKTLADRVEAEYIGEPRPPGLAGKLLAPRGGVVTHFDRFILPSISQVEYRLGSTHLVVSTAMTPMAAVETHLFAMVTFRTPFPRWLVRWVLTPVGTHIFRQDAKILELQRQNAERFGGEHFVSTEIDVLGLQIARLLKLAAKGERGPALGQEHRLRMRV